MCKDFGNPLSPEQQERFVKALEEIKELQKKQEKEGRERPRIIFFDEATKAGFTHTQMEFMWSFLAKSDHQHWDGRIG